MLQPRRHVIAWTSSLAVNALLIVFSGWILLRPPHLSSPPPRETVELQFVPQPPPVQQPPAAPTPPPPLPMPDIPPPDVPPPPVPPQMAASPDPVPAAALPVLPPMSALPPSPRPKPEVRPRAVPVAPPANLVVQMPDAQVDGIYHPAPDYPVQSKAAHEQGLVLLQVDVATNGEPEQVTILQTSGYPRLDQAARQAVESWKFKPAVVSGVQVRSQMKAPIRFELQ